MGLREVVSNLENIVQAAFDGKCPVELVDHCSFRKQGGTEDYLGKAFGGSKRAIVDKDHFEHSDPLTFQGTIAHEAGELGLGDDNCGTLANLVDGLRRVSPPHVTNIAIAAEMALGFPRVIERFQRNPFGARQYYLDPRKEEPPFAREVRKVILERLVDLGIKEEILPPEFGQVQVDIYGLKGLPTRKLEVKPLLHADPREDARRRAVMEQIVEERSQFVAERMASLGWKRESLRERDSFEMVSMRQQSQKRVEAEAEKRYPNPWATEQEKRALDLRLRQFGIRP